MRSSSNFHDQRIREAAAAAVRCHEAQLIVRADNDARAEAARAEVAKAEAARAKAANKDKTESTPFLSYYSQERSNRHHTAMYTIHDLYNHGRELIDKGTAYSGLRGSVNAYRRKLMSIYNSLPKIRVSNGSSHAAYNLLQPVFIIRVALDHISSSEIMNIYQKLEGWGEMTMRNDVISLPKNGGEFLSNYAAPVIVSQYIQNNPQRFTDRQRDKCIRENHALRFILGDESLEYAPLFRELMIDPITAKNNPDYKLQMAEFEIKSLIRDLEKELRGNPVIRFFTDFHNTKQVKLNELRTLQRLIENGKENKADTNTILQQLSVEANKAISNSEVIHTSFPLQSRTARLLSEILEGSNDVLSNNKPKSCFNR